MSNQFDERLLQIDDRLEELNLEKQRLIAERNDILVRKEAELAKHFNQHAPPEAKVEPFISYFKGRNDIYPFRWESQKGRSGYSPACWNEWKPRVCNKPKVSCTECTNQNFKAYDQQAVWGHLMGNQTIGIYPLLENNTTHILAADFDKDDWHESVQAYAKACNYLNIPYIIERFSLTYPEFTVRLAQGYKLSLTIMNDEGSGCYLLYAPECPLVEFIGTGFE